jgi:hypothetical protein
LETLWLRDEQVEGGRQGERGLRMKMRSDKKTSANPSNSSIYKRGCVNRDVQLTRRDILQEYFPESLGGTTAKYHL